MSTFTTLRAPLRAACGLLALGALALPLAACGSAGRSNGDSAATADDARDTAQLKLEQCLRQQGVELPGRQERRGEASSGTFEARPSDAETEKMRTALEGPCKDEQQAVAGSISEEDRAAFEDAQVKMSACMKEHGVDLPSPSDDGPSIVRIDAEDDDVREAMEACRDLLPKNMDGGPGLVLGGQRR